MKQNLPEEKLAIGLTAQRKYKDLKMRHLPRNFSTFIEEIPLMPPAFPEIISSVVGHYSGKKKKREKEHDWPRRPWCPRGASQHVVTPNLSSCQTKVQTFITASWPWMSLPRGFLYKRQIKNTSFHLIPSPCIFSGLYNLFIFLFSSTPPTAANPATLRPITMSRERQRCLNELQSKRNYRSCSARKKK